MRDSDGEEGQDAGLRTAWSGGCQTKLPSPTHHVLLALIRALRTAVEEVDINREEGLHSCGWTTLTIGTLRLHSRHGRRI